MDTLTDQFKNELPPFLQSIGVNHAAYSDLEGTKYSGRGVKLVLPKSRKTGFDISFEAFDDGIYPAVEGMKLVPLDVMANFEITWCKRFLLSALSDESQLSIFSHRGIPYRCSLEYFDPWTKKIEVYSSPKWIYPFWRKGVREVFQNVDIKFSETRVAKVLKEVDLLVERGQVL